MSNLDGTKMTFRVEIKNMRGTDLKCRHRFKEKLRTRIYFDDKRFKSDKEQVGGGDVAWKNTFAFEWVMNSEHTSEFVFDFVKTQLEQRCLKIEVLCNHDEKTTGAPLGSCMVDLYTLATGPVDHNLPLEGDTGLVGRMNFSVEMTQVSDIVVILKEIHVKNLHSTEEHSHEVNPYLKYAYSKDWPAIVDGKMRATYSETLLRCTSPSWEERQLPWLKFKASLNELVRESLVMHVTHKGKITNTTLGRCNLLFRTLVDGGKSFKEEDLISFKGPLNKKDLGTTIEGRLVFKFLPIFAQMKAVAGGRQALHTEKGIYDSMPLLTWVPRPNDQMVRTDNPSAEIGTPKTMKKSNSRTRANSEEGLPSSDKKKAAADAGRKTLTKSAMPPQTKNLMDSDNDDGTAPVEPTPTQAADSLIDFDPTQRRRAATVSVTQGSKGKAQAPLPDWDITTDFPSTGSARSSVMMPEDSMFTRNLVRLESGNTLSVNSDPFDAFNPRPQSQSQSQIYPNSPYGVSQSTYPYSQGFPAANSATQPTSPFSGSGGSSTPPFSSDPSQNMFNSSGNTPFATGGMNSSRSSFSSGANTPPFASGANQTPFASGGSPIAPSFQPHVASSGFPASNQPSFQQAPAKQSADPFDAFNPRQHSSSMSSYNAVTPANQGLSMSGFSTTPNAQPSFQPGGSFDSRARGNTVGATNMRHSMAPETLSGLQNPFAAQSAQQQPQQNPFANSTPTEVHAKMMEMQKQMEAMQLQMQAMANMSQQSPAQQQQLQQQEYRDRRLSSPPMVQNNQQNNPFGF